MTKAEKALLIAKNCRKRMHSGPSLMQVCEDCVILIAKEATVSTGPEQRDVAEFGKAVEERRKDETEAMLGDRPYNSINDACERIAAWAKSKGFDNNWDNVPQTLMLIVTELAEAMEAYRVNPYSDNFKEEVADTVIRLFHMSGALHIDLEKEISKKMAVNESRPHLHGKLC
jgi:NTP pyrophosphatase (non-canonical NTP hydrolase)